MKGKHIVLLVVFALIFLSITRRGVSDYDSNFIIENADATNTVGVFGSSTLITLLSNVLPHVVVEYANNIRDISMVPVPTALNSIVSGIAPHIIIEYANNTRFINMVSTPSTLSTILSQTLPHIGIEYANANRVISLAYPIAIIGDTTSPTIIGSPAASTFSSNTVGINWTTSEYTRTILHYGTSPGVYGSQITDNLYSMDHQLLLSALNKGETYYYQITSIDRSGNQSESNEYSFVVSETQKVFIPIVRR